MVVTVDTQFILWTVGIWYASGVLSLIGWDFHAQGIRKSVTEFVDKPFKAIRAMLVAGCFGPFVFVACFVIYAFFDSLLNRGK